MLTYKKAPLAAAAALVVFGLAGCFGGGGDGSSTTPATPATPAKVATAGAMVDGLVKGATVYCDVNGDGVGQATEPQTKTDDLGNYNFEDCNYAVVGTGGINIDTGFAFTGMLKSPAGAKFMTPLTTLVTGTGLSMADLAKLLGLPEGTDPTKVDPTKDVGLMKTTLAVQQVMAQLAATIQAAAGGGSVNLGAIYAQVATSLADTLKSASATGTPLISSTGVMNVAMLESAAKAAASKAGATISDADLKAVSAAIKSQSEQFLDKSITSLADLTKKASQLQNPDNPDVKIDPKAGSQYFALENDSITIDTKPVTLTDLQSAAGVTLSSFDKIGVKVNVTGAPPVGTSAVAMELVEEGGSGRVLRVALDKANLTLANGQLAMAIPADAKVYLYGKKGKDGALVTYSGPLGTAKKPLSFAAGNVLTIDYSAIVNRVKEASTASNEPTLSSFLQVKGTFNFKAVLSNFNLRQSNGDALTSINLKVTEDSPAILGAGLTGKITVN